MRLSLTVEAVVVAVALLLLVEPGTAFLVTPSPNHVRVASSASSAPASASALFESSSSSSNTKETISTTEDLQQMILTLEKRLKDGPGTVSALELQELQARSDRVLVDLQAHASCIKETVAAPADTVATSATSTTVLVTDLQQELDAKGLGDCHGILHASGVRRLADLQFLKESQITDMKADDRDRSKLLRVQQELMSMNNNDNHDASETTTTTTRNDISTVVDGGAFDRPAVGRFDPPWSQDFCVQVISKEHDIFKARLFTVEQCQQINRMAEYHAYPHRNRAQYGHGWTNKLYTLTAQHLLCKDIPGMLSTTDHIFKQLLRELYHMFPNRIKPGTICWESPGEPHLVKYNGESKGTEMHIDNSEFVYLTINAVLSADDEFTGGGTYIKAIDQTIHLQQGEMLIHLGDLEHAGADITSGVRRLLIAFLACEWHDEELNIEKLHEARDYVPPSTTTTS